MHWSLLLLVACCAARAAAAQEVPAFVCATTEPHPAVQASASTRHRNCCELVAAPTSRGDCLDCSQITHVSRSWLQAAVEAKYTQYKTAQAGQRSAGFTGVTIPVAWHVISQACHRSTTLSQHLLRTRCSHLAERADIAPVQQIMYPPHHRRDDTAAVRATPIEIAFMSHHKSRISRLLSRSHNQAGTFARAGRGMRSLV